MSQPKILLIACGGTISSTPGENTGVVPSLTSEQLVYNIPALSEIASIDTRQFRQLASSEIALTDIAELAELIANTSYAGYVITHGTDSIEETAFSLDLLYRGVEPVVITGAMRHPGLESADGNANILAAVVTACDPAARDLGVLVTMNDDVHAARFAAKGHTSSPAAFHSRIGGALGWVSENRLMLNTTVKRMTNTGLSNVSDNNLGKEPAVPILTSFSGDDACLLAVTIQSGKFSGIVIEALGGGHVTNAMAEQIETAVRTIPVVITSRTGSGSTLTSTYGYPGSEIDLISKGAIMAGWLSATQARIYLQLLLASGAEISELRDRFKEIQLTT